MIVKNKEDVSTTQSSSANKIKKSRMCKTFSFTLVCIFVTVKIMSLTLQEMCIHY